MCVGAGGGGSVGGKSESYLQPAQVGHVRKLDVSDSVCVSENAHMFLMTDTETLPYCNVFSIKIMNPKRNGQAGRFPRGHFRVDGILSHTVPCSGGVVNVALPSTTKHSF